MFLGSLSFLSLWQWRRQAMKMGLQMISLKKEMGEFERLVVWFLGFFMLVIKC